MSQKAGLKRSLGMWAMVMLGLGYLTPSVVFDTFGMASRDSLGHVPASYALTLVAMIFTALSYGKMVRIDTSAGSSYSYSLRLLGPNIGFMVGWLSLLDYLLLPMINVLLAKQYLSVIFPAVAPWIWVVIITGFITLVNIRGIESTASINSYFVYFQLAIVVIFVILCVGYLNNGSTTEPLILHNPFYSENFDFGAIVSAATLLCFSFLGFDAVSNYVEEAHNHEHVAHAIILTAIIGGGIFIIASYFSQLVFPDLTHFSDVENTTAPDIARFLGGKIFEVVFLLASFAGVVASGLASHASVSRLLYVMGRDNMLPAKVFAHVSPKYFTPIYNKIFVGFVCLTAFFFNLENGIYSISFGSLIAFSFVNICAFVYAWRHEKKPRLSQIALDFIIPITGFLVTIVLWFNIKGPALGLGLVWGCIGIGYWLLYGRKCALKHPAKPLV